MDSIRITALRCGSMTVRPREAFIDDRNPLAQRITLPVNAFLLEHPRHGRILIDTGWSKNVKSILPKHLLDFYSPEINPGETAAEQLEEMGIHPRDIDLILLTHLDADHTCGLTELGKEAGRVICSELEYFYSCRYVYKKRQVWDTWMPYLGDSNDRVFFRASVLGPVKRGFDVFGDDSVICVYCPGHTDGIVTTLVSQSPSNRFIDHGDGKYGGSFAVFASDTAFSQRNIDTLTVPGYGFDRKQQRNALEFLRELQADPMHRVTFFSHSDPADKNIML